MTKELRVKQAAWRVLGGEPEPAVRPLLLTVGLGVTAQYTLWSFFALWAIERLGMAPENVGFAFLAAGVLGLPAGLLGGRISDAVGRRPVILVGAAAQAVLPALLALPFTGPWAAAGILMVLTVFGTVRWAAQSALMADLVPEERREAAFGSFRVAFNVGAVAGPLLGAALVTVAWPALHAGVAVLGLGSFLAALQLPRLPAPARAHAGGRTPLRGVLLTPVFALVFGGAALAMVVYSSFEALMPVSLTQTHGYAPAAWGLVFAVNPVLVVLFQLRVTRWTQGMPAGAKLALALLVMGGSFLVLPFTAAAPALVLMVVVFVVGEMLWAPTADALAARLAPEDSRGAFLGAIGVAPWLGGALAPAAGLQVRAAWGDGVMWVTVAAISVAAAALYAAAAARASREERLEVVPAASSS